jgi:putative AdoMet-dependent methyltransferase
MPEFEDKWGFNDWAKSYDQDIVDRTHNEAWIFDQYNSVLDKVVEYCELSKNNYLVVLDIGIGTGNLAARFLQEGLHVIGIDPSKEMRKICKNKYPDLQVRGGDFLNIHLAPRSVDVIVSSYAFHHLTSTQKETSIPKMKRVLKPKGRVVIADLMFKNVLEEERIKLELRESYRTDVIEVIEDEYFGSFDDLSKAFNTEGFSVHGEQLTPFVWILRAMLSEAK